MTEVERLDAMEKGIEVLPYADRDSMLISYLSSIARSLAVIADQGRAVYIPETCVGYAELRTDGTENE